MPVGSSVVKLREDETKEVKDLIEGLREEPSHQREYLSIDLDIKSIICG